MQKIIQIEGVDANRFYGFYDSIIEKIESLEKNLQPKEPTKLMTRQDVAEFLSIALVTVSDWTKKGILKSYNYGNRVYYKRSEVEAGLIANENRKNRNQ